MVRSKFSEGRQPIGNYTLNYRVKDKVLAASSGACLLTASEIFDVLDNLSDDSNFSKLIIVVIQTKRILMLVLSQTMIIIMNKQENRQPKLSENKDLQPIL